MVLGLRVMFSCCLEARGLAALLIEVCPQFLEATCSSLPHGFLQYGCLLLQSQQSRETPARMAYCSSNMPVMLSTFSPLLKLFALPWNVYPSDSSMACFFISFRSLLRCHLLAEVFPNYLIWNCLQWSIPTALLLQLLIHFPALVVSMLCFCCCCCSLSPSSSI